MTHVKNAESYSRLVDICTGLGGTYNPGHETLQVAALLAQQKKAKEALEQVIVAKTDFDTAVNQRKRTFQDLRPLTASVLRTLEASGATPEKLEDARAFVHQITGRTSRKRVLPPAEGAVLHKRSVLQMAYVSQADSFAKLVKAIAHEPLYKTNEVHLSVESLTAKLKQLEALNVKVSEARVCWSNSLIHRNEVMYGAGSSLRKTVSAVRKYVRALFGLWGDQYTQLKRLRFTKIVQQ